MGKLRLTVLIVSIMPMILNLIVYLLSKNKRFVKTFFGERDGPNSMVTVVTCNNWLVPPQCSDFILV